LGFIFYTVFENVASHLDMISENIAGGVYNVFAIL